MASSPSSVIKSEKALLPLNRLYVHKRSERGAFSYINKAKAHTFRLIYEMTSIY